MHTNTPNRSMSSSNAGDRAACAEHLEDIDKAYKLLLRLAHANKPALEVMLQGLYGLTGKVKEAATSPAEMKKRRSEIMARNLAAEARYEAMIFEELEELTDLVNTDRACLFLGGISKQAVSLRLRGDSLLAYRYRNKVFYPAFQFDAKAVKPEIVMLTRQVMANTDLEKKDAMNALVIFLSQKVNMGEQQLHRYELFDEGSDVESMYRAFCNRTEQGQ